MGCMTSQETSTKKDELSDVLGMKKAAIYSRAFMYRKKGILLKKLRYSKSSRYDWDELSKFADLFIENEENDQIDRPFPPKNAR